MKINEWELLYSIKDSPKWRARCSCGLEFDVFKSNVTRGLSKRCRKCQAIRQKETTGLRTHGLSREIPKLYNVWSGIKRRCYNQNQKSYKDYGGKGIRMCDEWLNDYSLFHSWSLSNGYAQGLEIDRIDSFGNYEPSNCRFISKSENIRLAHYGKSKSHEAIENMSLGNLGWTKEEMSNVIDMCLSGDYRAEELAQKLSCDRHTLKDIVTRNGHKTNWRKGSFTRKEVDDIRLDVTLMSRKEVIKKYNSNHETIGCIINKRGVYGSEYYI